MIGPVFRQEMLRGSRRGSWIVFRRIYAGWLILQFYYLYWRDAFEVANSGVAAWFVGSYLELFLVQQFLLLLLVTPVFVAGVITDEKVRGTLQQLLTTPLSSWEIVVGRLLGRLTQLVLLAMVGLPFVCLVGAYGDRNLPTLLALVAGTLAPMFALGAVSVLVSVWSRHTRDAVLTVYAVVALGYFVLTNLPLWILAAKAQVALAAAPTFPFLGAEWRYASLIGALDWLRSSLDYLNPFYVAEPIWLPHAGGEVIKRMLLCYVAWGAVGLPCVVLAAWRLRSVYVRQMERDGIRKIKYRIWTLRPRVGDSPIAWKERHVGGLAPLAILRRLPTWFGVLVTVGVTYLAIAAPDWIPTRVGASQQPYAQLAVWVLVLSVLLVGIRASGAVTGEREKQTWEALMLSPLNIRELINGKLLGILAAGLPYLFAYALTAAVLALLDENPDVYLWTLPLLIATWLTMYLVGAIGIYCSVRFQNSWQSLLATLTIGYTGAFVLAFLCFPVYVIAAYFLAVLMSILAFCLALVELDFGLSNVPWSVYVDTCMIASVGVPVWIFWRLAQWALREARRLVAKQERTPFWKAGINCGWAVEYYMSQWENKHA